MRSTRHAAPADNRLKDAEKDSQQRQGEARTELQHTEAQLADAARRLTDAQREAANKTPSYAVIPYEGTNGTHRRPIYLECRPDAIVLQPEGIQLLDQDFKGPMDTDNPLAATLAAVRAYVTHRNGYDPKRDGEPYPLLLVRPDGIIAYAVARAAIKASYTEFGYELIGADWKLRFPDPDLGLARAASGALLTHGCVSGD